MDATDDWPSDWLRGVLDLCVLRCFADGPSYGYAVATRIEESGLGAVKGGTLYPLLGRLERDGDLESEWRPGEGGPGRKYYRLTEAGTHRLALGARRWAAFTGVTVAALGAAPDDETTEVRT